MSYSRPHLKTLQARLDEPPKFMIVVAGPRQIGKSTMVRQALAGRPSSFEATDQSATVTVDPFSDAASTIQGEPGAKATENGSSTSGHRHAPKPGRSPRGNAMSWQSMRFRRFQDGQKSSRGFGTQTGLGKLPCTLCFWGLRLGLCRRV